MKKILSFLVAFLMLSSGAAALAEVGEHAFAHSSFSGMLSNDTPDGYGILTTEEGKIILAEMQGTKMTGYMANLSGTVLEGSVPENFSLMLAKYVDGNIEGKCYSYFASGKWNETVYQNGKPLTSTVVMSDGAVKGYEKQNDKWVLTKEYTPAEIEGTIFAAGPMTLFTNIDENHTCIVFYSNDTDVMGGGVNIRTDGTSYLFFGENGAFCYGDMNNEAYYTGTLQGLSPIGTVTAHYLGGMTREASATEVGSINIDDVDDMLLLADTFNPENAPAADAATDAQDSADMEGSDDLLTIFAQ